MVFLWVCFLILQFVRILLHIGTFLRSYFSYIHSFWEKLISEDYLLQKEHTVSKHRSTTKPGGPKAHVGKVTTFQKKAASAALVTGQYF